MMKRETRLFVLGTFVAISIFGGLFLLLAAQPSVAESVGTSIALADAPLIVKVLVGLAILISGVLLMAPLLQAQPKSLH